MHGQSAMSQLMDKDKPHSRGTLMMMGSKGPSARLGCLGISEKESNHAVMHLEDNYLEESAYLAG